jgi:hypothetical protein
MRWKPAFAGLALVLVMSAIEVTQNRVTRSDLVEIRTVISRQIEAFRRDDAKAAFALVSPGVQHSFGTPERFLHVVRTTYRAVYRPANLSFLDLVVIGSDVVQQIHVTDHTGGLWVAYFSMQRQRDGSWRMNGCHLVQSVRTISA